MPTTFIQMLETASATGEPIIIDGGLGTALENRGIDLSHELWSASLLRGAPDTVAEVHADFIRAGARIVTTASYQATPLGFEHAAISPEDGRGLIMRSVEVAKQAAESAQASSSHSAANGQADGQADGKADSQVLVAGSVGPYGAALGNGAEYTGDYCLSDAEFANFHRPRIEALVSAGVDLLAIETQPCLPEVRVLAALADEFAIPAWLSLTLAESMTPDEGPARSQVQTDGTRMADGTPLTELAEAVADSAMIRALGVNCVRPTLVLPALKTLASATDRPLIAYPNSGEVYDAATMDWHESASFDTSPAALAPWVTAGVRLIGGCCRTTPADIAGLARSVPRI